MKLTALRIHAWPFRSDQADNISQRLLICIRNSSRLWVSRWGSEKPSRAFVIGGPAYPQAGEIPHFLFAPFSFVNKGFVACEQVWVRWMIWASPPSLRVSNLKQLMAQARETSDLRLGAAALRFGRFEQMSPDRLIGALGQPGLTPAGSREHPFI